MWQQACSLIFATCRDDYSVAITCVSVLAIIITERLRGIYDYVSK